MRSASSPSPISPRPVTLSMCQLTTDQLSGTVYSPPITLWMEPQKPLHTLDIVAVSEPSELLLSGCVPYIIFDRSSVRVEDQGVYFDSKSGWNQEHYGVRKALVTYSRSRDLLIEDPRIKWVFSLKGLQHGYVCRSSKMSVKPGNGEDEEGNGGKQSWPVQTNRYGFILGNGEIDSDVPCPESVRHRESKWLSLMTQWEQVMEKKSNKVKSQCQKGIPASVRAKCWPLLCGAKNRKDNNRVLYKRLVEAQDLQGWTDIIKRDTDRQFPFHEMFQSSEGHGQKDLLEVLRAYTQYRPDEGYCQAQGPVAAVLLMNMPAQDAFWCLAQISELFLPGYYSPLLEGVLFDAAVLSSVLKKLCPTAHKHMQNQGVEPLMFATDWLMCLYSRHLPFNTLLRVWDLFFCYGVRVLFQVAVVLVHRCLGEARQRRECEGQMETLERLRGVKQNILNEQADAFIHEVCSVPLSLTELRKQTEKEMEKWKRERPNSNFDPRGRCHGHQMAWERTQEKQKGREQQKKNLVVTVMRSHSSLSPLVRKKWRKQRSNTNIEEWDGGGKNFLEESDFQENRRRSMCGLVGEKKGNWDSVLPQHMSKIDNKPCKISLEESYSLERKQRKDELENDSREKEKDNGQMGTYATGNPTEEKRDLQMGLDEHTVKMTTTLQTCNKKALFEQGSENRKQEVHSGSNIQKDEIHTEICMDAQGRLVKPIVPELENTPQEQRHPPQQEQLTDLPIELRTEDNVETLHSVEILKEPDKEEGIDQDLGNTNAIAEPSKTSEESDNKEDTVELRDCNLCSDVCVEGDVKVISRFSPQSKQGSVPSIRLPDLTESQDRENNMIVIFSAIKDLMTCNKVNWKTDYKKKALLH
ncbi:hypothetical protein DNTS_014672 [Danionella cerebrum]|uniref:Rab-GAP TBC domain-containing protein n=1 Tax=Danionella cerebrum TaxID=2873325 RepID=A0A553Q1Y2_9TELE|nr:hypothetical protein DNTS_014672 [Danionella translucida]